MAKTKGKEFVKALLVAAGFMLFTPMISGLSVLSSLPSVDLVSGLTTTSVLVGGVVVFGMSMAVDRIKALN